jgi:hypothetical protein
MMVLEIRHWLNKERGVDVSISTISRALKKYHWTRKSLELISVARSAEARKRYKRRMLKYTAEDLVFLDETIVNELTGFRYHAYGLISSPVRYQTDTLRGSTWSIIAAIDLDD